jgi:hypothetical protein
MVADGARFTTRFAGLLAILARHGIVDKGCYRREGISWLSKTSFVDHRASGAYPIAPCRCIRAHCRRASLRPASPHQPRRLPSGAIWLHEIKHDGFRVMSMPQREFANQKALVAYAEQNEIVVRLRTP